MKPKPPDSNIPDVPKELDMEQPEPVKPPQKSLTIWGIVGTVAGSIAAQVGLEPEIMNFIFDGLQWHDAGPIVTLVLGVLAIYGRKRASGPLGKMLNR